MDLCSHQDYIGAVAGVAMLVLEWWLGRTESTKSGSIIELLINILKSIFKKKE